MVSTEHSRPSTTNSVDIQDDFVALLLADEDLLRAEFDAIIAAAWPGPPPGRPGRHVSGRRAPIARSAGSLPALRVPRAQLSGDEPQARERSPPFVWMGVDDYTEGR